MGEDSKRHSKIQCADKVRESRGNECHCVLVQNLSEPGLAVREVA